MAKFVYYKDGYQYEIHYTGNLIDNVAPSCRSFTIQDVEYIYIVKSVLAETMWVDGVGHAQKVENIDGNLHSDRSYEIEIV